MKIGSVIMASLIGFARSDQYNLQSYGGIKNQVVPADPYYINPSSSYQVYEQVKTTYDPYISNIIPTNNIVRDSTTVSYVNYGQSAQQNQHGQQYIYDRQNNVFKLIQTQNVPYVVNSFASSQKNNHQINNKFNYGSSSNQNNENVYSSICSLPRIPIGGICRCPNDGIFVANRCISRETPPKNCNAPRTIINGQCICPNNQIYTSDNKCVQTFYVNNQNSTSGNECKEPRIKTLNGYCICPNNRIFISGQCLTKDPNFNIGNQPVYSEIDADSIASLGKYFRQFNGSNNNVYNPSWGSKGSLLQRRCPAFYDDYKDIPHSYLPNPRHLSNQLADVGLEQVPRSKNKVSTAFTFFGQFLDHDLDLTQSGQDEQMNIQIPYNDKFFSQNSKIPFIRSKCDRVNSGRMHRNIITSWIDGNQVYGSDQQTSRSLRSFKNGKLKTSIDNLLPRQDTFGLFLAGDVRANENVMLTSYHTVFMRQHNRVCDQIRYAHPQMNDQAIFRSARQWVIGLLQKIAMEQFVPILMGDQYDRIIGKYNGYKSYVNPNIPTQFSTAAFRVGHSLLVDFYKFVNKSGVHYQNVKLRDLFLNGKFVTSEKIDDAFRGMASNLSKQKSIKITDEVRNLLILSPNDKQTKLDLFSLNLQRARDHGLPSYNQARAAYGLKKATKFQQIQPNIDRADKLRKMYNNKIDDVELFVGIISQQPVNNGILGQLGCKIVGQAFRNLRDGDRFWYEGAYPEQVVRKIKQTTLVDIIRRNTNVGFQVQNDIFHYFQ